MTRRQTIVTYLVVVPFAIVLGFPFFFALITMFKTNLDLANVDHSPYTYNDLAGHLHWDFWNYATLDHVRFLFEETNYPTWLLNTAIVGGAVVVITLLLAMPAGYALARLAGGWGHNRKTRRFPACFWLIGSFRVDAKGQIACRCSSTAKRSVIPAR